jgi:MFS family permease
MCSGNEIGPFRAVEESTIAHLTPPEQRNHVIAWYTLIGTGGTALGLMSCGWATSLLQEKAHWNTIEAYRAVFIAYAFLGLLKFLLTLLLSAQCEANVQPKSTNATETAPLLHGDDDGNAKKRKKPSIFARLPNLSTESKVILAQLCVLFAFDNFGSGVATMYVMTR